jgi:hypothetical protein
MVPYTVESSVKSGHEQSRGGRDLRCTSKCRVNAVFGASFTRVPKISIDLTEMPKRRILGLRTC